MESEIVSYITTFCNNITQYHIANIIFKLLPAEYKCIPVSTSKCVWYKKLDDEYKRLDNHVFEINRMRDILLPYIELSSQSLHLPNIYDDYNSKMNHYCNTRYKLHKLREKYIISHL